MERRPIESRVDQIESIEIGRGKRRTWNTLKGTVKTEIIGLDRDIIYNRTLWCHLIDVPNLTWWNKTWLLVVLLWRIPYKISAYKIILELINWFFFFWTSELINWLMHSFFFLPHLYLLTSLILIAMLWIRCWGISFGLGGTKKHLWLKST